AIVTISEHIGDHTVLGQICGRQFLKEPGLHRTLIGDGIATSVSAFLGGLLIRKNVTVRIIKNHAIL
ncbi:hypothetical protein K8353_48545, partial [Burkholderia contaminans]|nr:hypothetical protein [Burkholderia contaminans]